MDFHQLAKVIESTHNALFAQASKSVNMYKINPYLRNKCITNDITNSIKKMTKRILAIPAACAAMPVNPKTPATTATMRKSKTQLSMT